MKHKVNLAIAVLTIYLSCLLACTSSRHVDKSVSTKETDSLIEASRRITQLELEVSHYKRRVEELENLEVSFVEVPSCDTAKLRSILQESNCDPALIDSLLGVVGDQMTTIERMADGSLKIQGNIKSLKQSKSKIEESLRNVIRENQTLREENELLRSQSKVKDETKQVQSEIKPHVPSFVWWLLVFLIGSVIIAYKFISSSKKSRL